VDVDLVDVENDVGEEDFVLELGFTVEITVLEATADDEDLDVLEDEAAPREYSCRRFPAPQ
tara:strand:+ start:1632 stop:1814 length:183 start_codon:yes stop_codon:yes gene_type:complete